MSGNWTPGPWAYVGKSRIRSGNPRQPVAAVMASGRTHEERAANARLIAAAPDLYAALAEMIAIDEEPITSVATLQARVDAAFAAASAALAKARGETK